MLILSCVAAALLLWLFSQCGLHHLSLYSNTPGAAQTDTDVPAVSDPAVTIVNNHPIFPVPTQLICAYAGGALTLTRAKLTTPKLRAINNVNLRPLDIVAAPSDRAPLIEYFHHPLSLNPIDENQVLANTSAIAATPLLIALWFGDGNFGVPQGDMFAIHASQSITLVSGGWASGQLTLDSPLPAGRYAVIGGEAFGTNLLFARLIFPNQVWRPGFPCRPTAAGIGSRYMRWGNLGLLGEFETFALPQLDTFGSAAGAQTIDLTLDVVRIR